MGETEKSLAERITQLEAEIAELKRPRTSLELVDDEGRTRLQFRCGGRTAALDVLNSDGVRAASIGVEADGGYLAIRGNNGQLMVYLDVEMYGGRAQIQGNSKSSIVLFGGDCDAHAGFHVLSAAGSISGWAGEGSASVSIARADGSTTARWPAA